MGDAFDLICFFLGWKVGEHWAEGHQQKLEMYNRPVDPEVQRRIKAEADAKKVNRKVNELLSRNRGPRPR